MEYILMGHKVAELADNEQVAASAQRAQEEVEVYRTDDKDEAEKILKEGGFIDSKGVYTPVTRIISADTVVNATGVSDSRESGPALRKNN